MSLGTADTNTTLRTRLKRVGFWKQVLTVCYVMPSPARKRAVCALGTFGIRA